MSLWYFAARTIPSVFSVYILLQERISPDNMHHCSQMLIEFVFIISVLYAQEILNIKCSPSPHRAFIIKISVASCVDSSMGPNTLKLKFRLESVFIKVCPFCPCRMVQMKRTSMNSKMMENKPHRISEYVEDGTYIVGAFHNRTITMEEEGAICNIV